MALIFGDHNTISVANNHQEVRDYVLSNKSFILEENFLKELQGSENGVIKLIIEILKLSGDETYFEYWKKGSRPNDGIVHVFFNTKGTVRVWTDVVLTNGQVVWTGADGRKV